MRSASIFEMIAVDDIASTPPTTMPSRQRRAESIAPPTPSASDRGHLRAAEAEHDAPHRHELRQAELEPHREHQEHHAELARGSAGPRVSGTNAERVRADQRAHEEVAQDRGQSTAGGRAPPTATARREEDEGDVKGVVQWSVWIYTSRVTNLLQPHALADAEHFLDARARRARDRGRRGARAEGAPRRALPRGAPR